MARAGEVAPRRLPRDKCDRRWLFREVNNLRIPFRIKTYSRWRLQACWVTPERFQMLRGPEFSPHCNRLGNGKSKLAQIVISHCQTRKLVPMNNLCEGRMITNGYRLLGSVRASQSKLMTVSPPAGLGRISRLGWGAALLPVSPPMTSIDPLARMAAVGYHRPRCERTYPQ